MAFIDWLKKQHADSLIASQRMAADPFLRGIKPGANTAPAPPGAIPFQRTKPGFFARDYKKEDLVKKVMIEKNDGTKEIKSEWEEPRFPVHQGSVRATALPTQQPTSLTPTPIGRSYTTEELYPSPNIALELAQQPGREFHSVDAAGNQIPNPRPRGMMYGDYPRIPRPQSSPPNMGVDAAGNPIQTLGPAPSKTEWFGRRSDDIRFPYPETGFQGIPVPGVDEGYQPPRPQRSLANMGMDLRPRLEMPGQAASVARSAARIPRQQMPPPRFVPPVDPSQLPTVQDRGLGTYDTGEPGVPLSGGFDWSGQALRENVGEDLRGVWNPIRERMQDIIEQIRRKREGQTMAPFDDVSRGTADFLSRINPFWGR